MPHLRAVVPCILALGCTAVGTGINAEPGSAEAATAEIAELTRLPFVSAPKFTAQGAHDALVRLSGTLTETAKRRQTPNGTTPPNPDRKGSADQGREGAGRQ